MLHTTPGVESRSFRASPWGAEFVEPSAFSRWGFPLVLGLICLLLLSAYTPLQAEFTIQQKTSPRWLAGGVLLSSGQARKKRRGAHSQSLPANRSIESAGRLVGKKIKITALKRNGRASSQSILN